jgi:nitrate reductase NapE component
MKQLRQRPRIPLTDGYMLSVRTEAKWWLVAGVRLWLLVTVAVVGVFGVGFRVGVKG